MEKIEEIVDLYNIKEKREQMHNNRLMIAHLKKEMSDLKLNRDVAIYAAALEKVGYGEEIHSYLTLAANLRNDPKVSEYIKLKNQVTLLEQQIVDYYRSIQIGLRNRLMYTDTPDIFVYYGMFEEDAIARNIVSDELAFLDKVDKVVLPTRRIESNRKSRHFYNKVSFKYLEELTKDNSLSIENKDLGKVKVLIKK